MSRKINKKSKNKPYLSFASWQCSLVRWKHQMPQTRCLWYQQQHFHLSSYAWFFLVHWLLFLQESSTNPKIIISNWNKSIRNNINLQMNLDIWFMEFSISQYPFHCSSIFSREPGVPHNFNLFTKSFCVFYCCLNASFLLFFYLICQISNNSL